MKRLSLLTILSTVLLLGSIGLMVAWVVLVDYRNLYVIFAGIAIALSDYLARVKVRRDSRGTPPAESETTMEVRLRRDDDPV